MFLMAQKRNEKETKMGNVDIELKCGYMSTVQILGDYVAPTSELDVTTTQQESKFSYKISRFLTRK